MKTKNRGFTIVELLVVIVVIGILAAITIVSYTGISRKAIEVSLQSDLTNGSKKLKMYQVEYGKYPDSMPETPSGSGTYCPTGPADTRYCIKASPGNIFENYSANNLSDPQTFIFDAKNTASTTTYNITNNTAPVLGSSLPTITIGTQVWMKSNLDVGIRINGGVSATNNGIVEKACYNNDPAMCTTYGGLYQWNELMQYITTEGTQGIAPPGFHIPTDAEYTILETYLGGIAFAGDKLKIGGLCQGRTPCGTSGFDALLGGYYSSGLFSLLGSYGYYWTSTMDINNAWTRRLDLTGTPSIRGLLNKTINTYTLSVRCIKD